MIEHLSTSWGNVAFERSFGDTPTLVFLHETGLRRI